MCFRIASERARSCITNREGRYQGFAHPLLPWKIVASTPWKEPSPKYGCSFPNKKKSCWYVGFACLRLCSHATQNGSGIPNISRGCPSLESSLSLGNQQSEQNKSDLLDIGAVPHRFMSQANTFRGRKYIQLRRLQVSSSP